MEREIELDSIIEDIAAGPFGSNLKVESFVKEGFPIIDGANLKGFEVTDNLTKFVSEEKARSLSRSIAKRGDVVVTISGTLGQIAYIPNDSQYEEYLCSQRQFRVSFDQDKVYPPYLVFYFHTKEGQSKILAFANQTGVPALAQPIKNFRKIRIKLPSLSVQKRIAFVVESINTKIQLNNQINDYLTELCDAITSEYIKSLTERDFHYGKLSELLEVRYGKDHKKLKDGLYPVYGSGGYMRSVECFLMSGESVLIPRKGSLNNVMYVNENFWTVDTMFYTVPHCPGAAKYAYHCLKKLDLALMNSGSAVPSMTTDILNNLQLRIPSEDSLLALDNKLMPNFESIQANRRENDFLSALRDCLLPKLMSCEINISMIEV